MFFKSRLVVATVVMILLFSIFFKCGYDLCNFCIDRCIFCFRRTVSTIILDRNGICQFIVGEQVAIAVINISACTV